MGRASNKQTTGLLMSRRQEHLRRLGEVRDVVGVAEGSGVPVTDRLVHQLLFLGQAFGQLSSNYRFAQRKWTPWSCALEADLERWRGEGFIELVAQSSGVKPRLRLMQRCRLLDQREGSHDQLVPSAWMAALSESTQNQRDVLVSAVLARWDGLEREEAHARLLTIFGGDASALAQRALDEADRLMAGLSARDKWDLIPA